MIGSLWGNLTELPKPVGKHIVGITQLDFTDKSRTQVFPFEENNACRKIPVTIFYPADNDGGKNSAPYSSPELLEAIGKLTFGLFSKSVAKVKTNCYQDVPISTSKNRYPVIIFNHGYGGYTMQNTVLCSDLASLGYIVVSIGHPYESSGVKYLDGEVIRISETALKNVKSGNSFQAWIEVFKASGKKYYSDSEAMELAEYFFKHIARNVNENIKIWVDDSVFVAEQLFKLNEGKVESIFKNKLNLDLGIGITGHSYGGATAAQACLNSDRFVAGINIDGGTCGNFLYKDINKPFMLIGSHLIKNISRTTYIYNTKDTYIVTLDNTQHLGYSDAVFILRQANLIGQIGNRNKYEFREIITNYHYNFFTKYLLKNETIELESIKYDGVQFKQKLNNPS